MGAEFTPEEIRHDERKVSAAWFDEGIADRMVDWLAHGSGLLHPSVVGVVQSPLPGLRLR